MKMGLCLQMNTLMWQVRMVLQDVQFSDQQRFKQFVSQSKARMEACLENHYFIFWMMPPFL
jgi:hypothetical protein